VRQEHSAGSVDAARGRGVLLQLRGHPPDLGHRLENAVALHLRRGWRELHYASERDRWEGDFIIPDAAIQVCLELTPANRGRELRGVIAGARLRGQRRAVVVTLDQSDHLREDGVEIEVVPAWRWLA
jgi:predicted AAA+ superfamily ATPase